jgi:excisionase family DNA binding protein
MSMDYRDPDWVSETLGLDRNTVYKFLQDGTLPAVQLGRKWLISESRLRTWLEEQTDRQTRSRRTVARMTERTVQRMDNLGEDAREVVRLALGEARRTGTGQLGQEHLLLGLAGTATEDSVVGRALRARGLTPERVRAEVEARTRQAKPAAAPELAEENAGAVPQKVGRTPRARQAMRLAAAEAQQAKRTLVTAADLLLGLLLTDGGVGREILVAAGLSADDVRSIIRKA